MIRTNRDSTDKRGKVKRRITVSSAKAKGRNLQNWVCKKVSDITGFQWGKDSPIESRSMGQAGIDVRLENPVLDLFPFSVECKNQEHWAVTQWIEQARINQIAGTSWLLVAKKNRTKPVVIMDAEVFFTLYNSYLDVLEAVGKIRRPLAEEGRRRKRE